MPDSEAIIPNLPADTVCCPWCKAITAVRFGGLVRHRHEVRGGQCDGSFRTVWVQHSDGSDRG
jgi:hypothetical protein